jgi:dimethylglycine dehydrogenase
MLGRDGRLKGDLTVFNWGDGTWWIMGSYYLRQWHMRWFEDHMDEGVEVRDISDATVGFGIVGPRSREVLASLTHQDVSDAALPFMGCTTLDVGLVRAKVGRMSVCGELGFEINCSSAEHVTLYRTLKAAGAEFGAVDFGFNAMLSLRIEKSFGIWSREFTQGYTAGETGMDRWIAWDKPDFTGKQAALAEREQGTTRQLVTLEVDSPEADATGYEPVWADGRRVGFITSGANGHCTAKSLAMALVEPDKAAPGTDLTTHIVGVERAARVIAPSPWDPKGTRMRG